MRLMSDDGGLVCVTAGYGTSLDYCLSLAMVALECFCCVTINLQQLKMKLIEEEGGGKKGEFQTGIELLSLLFWDPRGNGLRDDAQRCNAKAEKGNTLVKKKKNTSKTPSGF